MDVAPRPPNGSTAAQLRRFVEDESAAWESAPVAAILRRAHAVFGSRLCVTSSMADAVMVHLVSRFAPGTDVLFLDTGMHFDQTLAFRRRVQAELHLTVIDVRPRESSPSDEHTVDPDGCCHRRKVRPLDDALTSYDAWVSGVRRCETPQRSATKVLSWDERRQLVRIAPLAAWTDADVADYARTHALPVHPLARLGYTSIGCAPCTGVPSGNDPRSGRWPGRAKTECGLHTAGQ